MSDSDSDESWNDECIDEEIKWLISKKENGSAISLDMVAHMEYFYNTLVCSHKTVNPFECLDSYRLFPALHYKSAPNLSLSDAKTLMQQHRTIIFPNSNSANTQSASGSNERMSSG